MKRQAQFVSSGKVRSLEYLKKESVELSLTFCGYEECDGGYHYIPRKRSYYILHMISKGKGVCEINGETHEVEENDVMMIFPGMEYSFVADPEEGCTFLWIGFVGMRAEECVMHSGFSRENLIHKTSLIQRMEEIIECMLDVQELTFANDLRRNGLLKLFFSELIVENNKKVSETNLKQSHGPETSEHIKNAIAYIAEHYSQKLKINELADYVGVNRSYLASSFKKATGYSPQEYLLSLRMEKAKSLLEKTDMPINSIANSVGYNDQLAFSRMFKKYSGVSPRTYREEHKL